jgi:hypothetical protein
MLRLYSTVNEMKGGQQKVFDNKNSMRMYDSCYKHIPLDEQA